MVLIAYGGHKISPVGKCELNYKQDGISQRLEFFVVNIEANTILGLESCIEMKLVKRFELEHVVKQSTTDGTWVTKEDMIQEYSDVFEGNGCFEGVVHLEVDKTVTPAVRPPRKIAYSLLDKLEKTLESMSERGIIRKVNNPTDWVSDMVLVEKDNGSLRVCLDARPLNNALKRAHYKLPTAEEAMTRIAGNSFYTIMDVKEGFWCVQLDDESADLCTFHTPFGRYQFCRLPYGLSVSPEIFQRKQDEVLGEIQGSSRVTDDFAIAGKTALEHDNIVRQILDTARDKNVKFNVEKLQWKLPEVTFVGRTLTSSGIKPSSERVQAIVDMPAPENRTDLKRLLGMVNFVASFIPNMSEITAPLRMLLKQNVLWVWESEQENAMQKIRDILSTDPVLTAYDPSKPTVIQADASQHGLGACLLQEGKPVAFVSRSLTDTEQRYAQIEKELLSVVFACDKLYTYIYGTQVKIHTDHKPLLVIVKKEFHSLSPRLQRMVLRLQRYTLEWEYVPGRLMFVADTLSRATSTRDPESDALTDNINFTVHTLLRDIPVSQEWKQQIMDEGQKDAETKLLIDTCNAGWPEHKHQLPEQVRKFWNMRHDLYDLGGILFMGTKICIPSPLRKTVLEKLHESHLGVEKCKNRARSLVFWPGMSKDIEELVMTCTTCLRHRRAQQKETLIPHAVPDRAWQEVAVDIFERGTQTFILVVDHYSKYPEVQRMPDKTAKSVVLALKEIFARQGIPEKVFSDNMPFISFEFRTFAKDWGFAQVTSSPGHPQSNGLVERHIQTVKNIMRKAEEDRKDYFLGLLDLRATPLTGMKYSPSELLNNRKIKGKLPINLTTLQVKEKDTDIRTILQNSKNRQKHWYDQRAKDLPPLSEGDKVRIREKKTWEPGVVIRKHSAPRSYLVQNERKGVLRRNRRHLLYTGRNTNKEEKQMKGKSTVGFKQGENRAIVQSRSGRNIKLPYRFQDYIT